MAETTATLKEVREYFGLTMPEFRKQWTELDSESKTQLRDGIGNGTLTY
jgi:hypothetical protein